MCIKAETLLTAPWDREAKLAPLTPARQLVAGPFADDRAGNITDVILVEQQEGPQARPGQRLPYAAQPVSV